MQKFATLMLLLPSLALTKPMYEPASVEVVNLFRFTFYVNDEYQGDLHNHYELPVTLVINDTRHNISQSLTINEDAAGKRFYINIRALESESDNGEYPQEIYLTDVTENNS